MVPAPEPPPRKIQVRAGANGALAAFVPGVAYGANVSGRGGIQIRQLLGVYGDFGAGLGLGGSISAGTGGGGVSVDFASYWRLAAMGEIDLGPFFVALGPALFSGTWGAVTQIVTQSGAMQAAYVAAGYFPAVMTRVGVSFGKRSRFTIGLESMIVFGKMTSVSQNASQQGASQSVRVGADAIGWAPALMLGWDLR